MDSLLVNLLVNVVKYLNLISSVVRHKTWDKPKTWATHTPDKIANNKITSWSVTHEMSQESYNDKKREMMRHKAESQFLLTQALRVQELLSKLGSLCIRCTPELGYIAGSDFP